MKLVALIALVTVAAILVAMGWQHQRYLKARRGPVQDRQNLFYGSSTLHVVTYLRTRPGEDAIESLRKLRSDVEGTGQAKLVYAGLSPGVALESAQLDESSFDAVVLFEYPSREAYELLSGTSAYRSALDRFDAHYSHGMDRPVMLNLGIPMLLLGVRAYQIVTRQPSLYPLEPVDPATLEVDRLNRREMFQRMETLRRYNEDAIVIFNLLKGGNAEQRAADRGYGMKMAQGFAERAHGPMHFGRAITLEGDAEFDRVAIVYYPGFEYFQSLMGSKFFNGIVGGKQPGDTLAVPTIPVLSQL